MTLSEIDAFAQQYGIIINMKPLSRKFSGYSFPYRNAVRNFNDTPLLHVLNVDDVTFRDSNVATIKQIVNNLVVVLPQAMRIKTGTDITKVGSGMNLTE